MHPVFASAKRLGWYILAWQAPALLLAYLLVVSAQLSWLESVALCGPLCTLFAVVCLSPWYVCRVLPLRASRPSKVLINHLLAACVAAFFWTLFARWIVETQRFWPDMRLRMAPHYPVVFGVGALLYSLAVALHYTYLEVTAAREATERVHRAVVLAREAELKALKAQINPHFLFNCLNSISALTTVDPEQAREMCIRLSEFLRNTLRLGEKTSIPFGDEIALVRTYLQVEQVRFGSRLRLEQQIGEGVDRCVVPPLLLQPLVENAIKHGVAGLVDGGFIKIDAVCDGGMLRVIVENDFDPDSPPPRRSGLGLANVRNRVQARHGDRGQVNVTVAETVHKVEVIVPCEAADV